MTIGAILNDKGGEVVSAAPTTTVGEAVRLLHERRIGAVPVMDGGAVVGVFSERDVICALAERGATALDAPVTEAMSAPAITTEPAAPVLGALSQMTRRRVRHLPVCRNERLVGILSIGDLVKWKISEVEAEASGLKAYIAAG